MAGLEISVIPYSEWQTVIRDVIAVRTSAYLDWNGFYIQGTDWIQGTEEPRILFRKELKT